MERSFGLLKPDCLKRGIEADVLDLIRESGLEVVVTKKVRLTAEQVALIWPNCQEMPYWDEMVKFSSSGDCLVFLVEGENAILRLNDLVGDWQPEEAEEHTIRYRFGASAMENVIHSSSDEKAFEKESKLFFEGLR